MSAARMNVVDSCGWLEYFADAANADFFAGAIEDVDHLIVPSVSIFEVFKRILQQRGENEAIRAVAMMRQGAVVDLDTTLAMQAAHLSVQHKLPLADSLILATAQMNSATVWTQDRDFEGIPDVRYTEKR